MKKFQKAIVATFCVILLIGVGLTGVSLCRKSYTLAEVNQFLEHDTAVLKWQLEWGGGHVRSEITKESWFAKMIGIGRRLFSKKEEAFYVFWTPHNMVEVYVLHRGADVTSLAIAGPQADEAIKLIRGSLESKFPNLKYSVIDWHDEKTQQITPADSLQPNKHKP